MALIASGLLLLTGCVAIVHPPTAPSDPQTVFLVDEGGHASLVIPSGRQLTRYAYGDWNWMVGEQQGIGDAFIALFARSRAAIGRQQFPGPATPITIRQHIPVPVESVHPLVVPGAETRRLAEHLDALFDNVAHPVYSEYYGLEFAPHPRDYSLSHNSNHRVASWLERLGCRVEGGSPLSRWRVMDRGQ